jgi:glucan biosynthesis protein C
MTQPAQSERLHALDAVRGFALTLGVLFHAAMSFLPGPQIWPVQDNSPSVALSGLFFVLHIFRMTTFFLIAGYFGRMMLERRGVAGFVRDRAKRIALPLVIFWPIMLASIIGVSVWAAVQATGHIPAPPPSQPGVFGGFPLTHLWFLYVLVWLYIGSLALRALVLAVDRSGAVRAFADKAIAALVAFPGSPLLLALPFVLTTTTAPMWLLWFGVPTPDSNVIVNPIALASFGTAFGFGWLLNRQTQLMQVWQRRWLLNLSLAVALTTGLLIYAGVHPLVTPAPHSWQTLAAATAYGMATWTWTFALIGLALRFLAGHSAWRRYLADASYWIYLVHLPLVMALQTVAAPLAAPWWIKYPLILIAAFAIMLATYEGLVRYSFIGGLLNGRRAQRRAKRLPGAAPTRARQELSS